jgi:type I restriction enzyme, S subunit
LSDRWKRRLISSVADLNPETLSKKSPPARIRYVDISAVSPDGADRDAIKELAIDEAPSRARRIVRTGDVIVSTVRPSLRARAAIAVDLDGAVVSTGFCVLRPSAEIHPGYLDAVTRTNEFYGHLEGRQSGSAYPAVRPSDVGDALFLLPPLDEQRRIADVLRAFDQAIHRAAAQGAATRQLGEPIRGAMLELGGHPTKLRDISGPTGIQIGPFGSQLHAFDYRDEGTPVVMPRDMRDGRITTDSIARVGDEEVHRLARHRIAAGDILLPRRGDLTKRAFVLDHEEGWLCGTGSIRVRVPKQICRLVFEAINRDEASQWLISHAVGTTMLNLNTEIVGDLPLRLPELKVAQPFLDALKNLEVAEVAVAARMAALRAARSAVLSALLTGEWEIPESYDHFLDEGVRGRVRTSYGVA